MHSFSSQNIFYTSGSPKSDFCVSKVAALFVSKSSCMYLRLRRIDRNYRARFVPKSGFSHLKRHHKAGLKQV